MMLLVQLILGIFVGLGWALLGLFLALTLKWDRPGRMGVFTLGLMTGLYRIMQAAHDYMAGYDDDTFLRTPNALILNLALVASLGILNYRAYVTLYKQRGIGL